MWDLRATSVSPTTLGSRSRSQDGGGARIVVREMQSGSAELDHSRMAASSGGLLASSRIAPTNNVRKYVANLKERPRAPISLPLILRETFRHYLEYRALVMSPSQTSNDRGMVSSAVTCDHGVIEYGYHTYHDDDTIKDKVMITLSFWDLQGSLANLSPRKREAVFLNVILDWKQKDVAKRMGISTVSVGQYVQAAMEQLAVTLDLTQEVVA